MSNSTIGRLFYVIGASGSGKDSIISQLRYDLANSLMVAHRYITRPCDAGGENHIALSEAEFLMRQSRQFFLMDWQAHGLYYGIGQEVRLWLESGMDVLMNGSRGNLEQAKQQFGDRLVPVFVQVDLAILEERLHFRGRETSAQISMRLERAAQFSNTLTEQCEVVDNSGSLTDSVAQFKQLISFNLYPK